MSESWKRCTEIIKGILPENNFEKWIKPLRPIGLIGNEYIIEAPNKFLRDWIVENYRSIIMESLKKVLNNRDISLSFTVPDENTSPRREEAKQRPAYFDPSSIFINRIYTFENFVVGPCNQFAHAAALAVATNPAKSYNPLFIYGGVGLGKTHLLNAIANYIYNTDPGRKVCYVTSEKFMNELINSIRFDKMDQFRNKYRSMDVLLIDDIQFLSGKERTQEEFFHTFNTLYEARKQIVISSDRFPKDIPHLENRLKSRFESGLIADIQPPDFETLLAIIEKKMEFHSIRLPGEVVELLARNINSNIRELEGALVKLIAYASLTKREITIDIAKDLLKEYLLRVRKDISIEDIQRIVSSYFNIKLNDLKSPRRSKNLSFPRQIGMYLCRSLTKSSFPEIGIRFGGKDHATVIHAVRKIEKLIAHDEKMRVIIEDIKSNIMNNSRNNCE